MRPATLALDDIPPFRVPLRFYLTAPWFGVLAGLVWFRDGELALVSRWMPGTLASTHLLALGFLAMVMVGSLFQVLPVLGGGPIPRARTVAPLVHAALTVGTVALAVGLDSMAPGWLAVAVVALTTALGTFVPLLLLRLLRPAPGGALFTIRLAGLALAVTVGLGLFMAAGHAWPALGIGFRTFTDTHARFGLAGFTLLLVMGVSHQVIPMFHVTPGFDRWVARVPGVGVLAGLVLLAAAPPGAATPETVGATLVLGSGLVYAVAALRQLAQRRRRREPVVAAWQLALGCLALSLLVGWKAVALPGAALPGIAGHQEPVVATLLFGLGFAVTVILGMLGKIVPFLAFLHLQRRCLRHPAAVRLLPPMNAIVSDRAGWAQLGVHAIAVVAAVAAALRPELGRVAGAVLAADFALCGRNVIVGAWRYRRASHAIAAIEAGEPAAAPAR